MHAVCVFLLLVLLLFAIACIFARFGSAVYVRTDPPARPTHEVMVVRMTAQEEAREDEEEHDDGSW